MLKTIDNLLNKVTMYRLVLYELIFLLAAAAVLGFFGILAYKPLFILFSAAFIFVISWAFNRIFAYSYNAPYNPESTWITALILALIITPPTAFLDMKFLSLAFWASAMAMFSKYVLAIDRKHIFNPAAVGVAVTGLFLGLSASWWVGTASMLPFVLVGGLLVVRKMRRFDMWLSFILVFAGGILQFSLNHGLLLMRSFSQSFLYAPALFFSTVMLTEPATMPSTRFWRVLYGAGTALLFLPNVEIGHFYFTPELALLVGNIGAYVVSPKYKLSLKLKQIIRQSHDVYDFVFESPGMRYKPGQYMEWTLARAHQDSRGSRRYFTLASSPTEREMRLGVKFYDPSSTYKKELFALKPGESIVAGQLAGDFTLPRDRDKKLAFIAGGIGVTPFRSMVRYLIDTKEVRDIVMLYANKAPEDVVYRDLFDEARRQIGLRTSYIFSRLEAADIEREVPDYLERTFYISGPQGMVTSYKETLLGMGVGRTHIKTDYFPGF